MNRLGVPGFVRDTEYQSSTYGTRVRVKRWGFFTVVSVDGVDVYFDRFSGKIEGVGFSPATDSAPGAARKPRRSVWRHSAGAPNGGSLAV